MEAEIFENSIKECCSGSIRANAQRKESKSFALVSERVQEVSGVIFQHTQAEECQFELGDHTESIRSEPFVNSPASRTFVRRGGGSTLKTASTSIC